MERLDKTPLELHFHNGYIDLKDNTFKQRQKGLHYISNYIKRDYKPSTLAQRNMIYSMIAKIYPSREDLDVILMKLGSTLSGKGNLTQEMLFLLGKGSNGKSAMIHLLREAFDVYFMELNGNSFSTSKSTELNKKLNTYETIVYLA